MQHLKKLFVMQENRFFKICIVLYLLKLLICFKNLGIKLFGIRIMYLKVRGTNSKFNCTFFPKKKIIINEKWRINSILSNTHIDFVKNPLIKKCGTNREVSNLLLRVEDRLFRKSRNMSYRSIS